MNSNDELGDLLTVSLNRAVDGMSGGPLTLRDVRSRAGRIRRNRVLAAGAGVAAVLAVIVPTTLMGLGGSPDGPEPAETPPQTVSPTKAAESPIVTPMVDGKVTLDPDAPVGADPAIAWREADPSGEGTLHLTDGSTLAVHQQYFQLVELPDRVVGLYVDPNGRSKVDVLDRDGAVLETSGAGSGDGMGTLAVDEQHTSAAWVGTDGKVSVTAAGTNRALIYPPTIPGERPRASAIAGETCTEEPGCTVYVNVNGYGGGVSRVDPSAARSGEGPSEVLTSLADLSTKTGVQVGTSGTVSPSAPNGEFCAAAVDQDTSAQLWENCEEFLTTLSPDGRFVLSSYGEGYGATSVRILDAATGMRVLEASAEGATFWNATWEDESHVLFSAEADGRVQLFRLGVDGTLERAGDHSVQADGSGTPWIFELR